MRAIRVLAVSVVLVAGCQTAAVPNLRAIGGSRAETAAPTAASTPVTSAVPVEPGRIAFQQGGVKPGIYTIDADGHHKELVIAGEFETPRWSPDRKWMAISAIRPDGSVVPALVRPDGTGYHELALAPGLDCGLAAWDPYGVHLALECWDDHDPTRTGVYLISTKDGTGLHQITSGRGLPGQFTADGRRLLFGRNVGTEDDPKAELRLIDIDGRHERTIATVGVDQIPGFLPGEAAIYAAVDGVIDVFDVEGKVLRSIAAPERHILDARLSPDGQSFAFVYDPQPVPCPGIYRMGTDGSGVTTIEQCRTAGSPAEQPDWAP